MKLKRLALLGGFLILVWTQAVSAKGLPDKIVINGAELTASVEITERQARFDFNPWQGKFIEWSKGPVSAPLDEHRAYDVTYYMMWRKPPAKGGGTSSAVIYGMRYCPGADGQPGYIYLPGDRDEQYEINRSTITRDGADGKWHQASAAWDALMRRVTADRKRVVNKVVMTQPGFFSQARGQILAGGIAAAGLGIVLIVARGRKRFHESGKARLT